MTVANYEYLVYWRLYQDGSIECHVRATGIMVVGHLPEGEPARHGTMVDQRTYALFHQHFLIARLDMDVDGSENTVHMVESGPAGYGDDDPYGLGLIQRAVPLRTRVRGQAGLPLGDAARLEDREPGVLEPRGALVAYKLGRARAAAHAPRGLAGAARPPRHCATRCG